MKTGGVKEDGNYFTVKSEKEMYQRWINAKSKVPDIPVKTLKRQQQILLLKIIENELPEKEKQYLIDYFYNNLRVLEIAKKYGVHRSTASRGLKRGVATLRRYAKYISLDLYKIMEQNKGPKIHFTNNRIGRLG